MDASIALRRAREAIARDDPQRARRLLAQVLRQQPNTETAWIMLSTVVDQPDHKRDCLERVLRINPGNDAARAQLAALDALSAAASPASEASPVGTGPEEPEAAPAETGPAVAQGEHASSPPGDSASPSSPTELAPEDALPSSPAAEPAPEDAAADVEQETVVEAPQLPPEPAADALAAPLGEPVPELHGEPSSPASATSPEAAHAQSRSLLEALDPSEVVLHWTKLSPGVFLRPIAAVLGAGILFLLPTGDLDPRLVLAVDGTLLVLALAYLGLRAIRYFGSEYVVTDRRVLAKRGIMARWTVDIPIAEIEEVTVGRGLFGRSPSSGNVWIRRTDRTRVMFWRIRSPGKFAEAIDHARAVPEPVE